MRKKLFYKYCLSLGFGAAVAFLGHSNLMASDNPMDPETPFYNALSGVMGMDFYGSSESKNDVIEHAGELTELHLTFKGITMLPESIRKLGNLGTLNLSWNKLTVFPDSIGNLGNLKVLNLSQNNLQTLPESIRQLGNLTRLNLSWNQLQTLPDSIGNLLNLEWLELTLNNLQAIPDSIGNLGNLKVLNLSQNNLQTLPESIRQLGNLRSFAAHANPLNNQSIMLVCGLVIDSNEFQKYFAQFYIDLRRLDNNEFQDVFYSVYDNRKEVIALVNQNLPQPIAEEVRPEMTDFKPKPDADKINKRLQGIAIRKGIPAEFFDK